MKRLVAATALLLSIAACSHQSTEFGTDEIVITSPAPQSTVSAVVEVTGQARGSWYFEANFPLAILDAEGNILAESYGEAQGDWMTEEFVPFVARLEIYQEYQGTGTLLIENANASGLPENDRAIEMPIDIDTLLLTSEEKAAIEEYITEYIGEISPQEPELGGTFYVTDITWDKNLNEAIVEYEDGHIALKGKAIIGVYENGDIALDDFILLEE